MHDLGWDLVRATEAAARAAAELAGRGDKLAADRAATQALRASLDGVDFLARVAVGEGEKDGAPGLFAGDIVGRNRDEAPAYDLAVDPIDGTTQTARGGPEALSALALGPAGSLLATRTYYMKKIAIGPVLALRLGGLPPEWLETPPGRVVEAVGQTLGLAPVEVTVCVLDRPRHERLIRDLRETGCRVWLQDCDVSATVAAALPGGGAHLTLGVGGVPEAVLCAAALKCLGGDLVGMLADPKGERAEGPPLRLEALVRADVLFAATGITDGSLLRGAHSSGDGTRTHSLLLSSADRTVRWIETLYPVRASAARG